MAIILKRKILTAILSSFLFALIFSVAFGFERNAFLNIFYINFMIVVTYGVITSFISDWLSKKFSTSNRNREIVSFFLHICFGLVFREFSLVTAIIFFGIDRLLSKVNIKWWTVILALLIVVIVFIINVV